MTPASILTVITRKQPGVDADVEGQRALWRKFGASIRATRRKRKIPLKSFAKGLGYTPAMVAMLETGKREWAMEKARRATELLK